MKNKVLVPEAHWNEKREYWQINVQQERIRRSFYSPNPGKAGKREAETKAAEWLVSHKEGDLRMSAAWDQFMTSRKKTLQESSYATVANTGGKWFKRNRDLMARRISRVTVQDWQDIIDTAYEQGLSRRTCCNIRALAEKFGRFAENNRWPMESIAGKLTINTHAPKQEKKILQPDQYKELFSSDLAGKDGRHCIYIHCFRLAVILGLRRGEICGLRWDDITDNVLHVQRSINSLNIETRGKTDNAIRNILLPQAAQDTLADQREMLKSRSIISPWIFPDAQGKLSRPNAIYNQWKAYREAHGIESSFHGLRHTMISVYKADVPEQLLKEVVGHSVEMDTFGVYGKEVDGEAQRTANLMDGVVQTLMNQNH